MTLEYWFMLPVAALFSALAMAFGVGSATFQTPFLILALGLSPEVAIGSGLLAEVFGFASGIIAYSRRRLIDYRLGLMLLVATMPMAVLGAWVAGVVDADILKLLLGGGLFIVAVSFLRTPGKDKKKVPRLVCDEEDKCTRFKAERCITTAEGHRYCYTFCHRYQGFSLAGLGGLFLGMISTGLGELDDYFFLRRCRMPSNVAVATSVFIIAFTALAGSGGHIVRFAQAGGDELSTVLGIAAFAVPGAIVGALLGVRVSVRIPEKVLVRSMGILFLVVAGLTLGEAFLG